MTRFLRSVAVLSSFLFLLFVVTSSQESLVFAQQVTGVKNIGTHLIEGDEAAQGKVLTQLTRGGVPANYPVVVMVYPNKTGVALLNAPGFLTIARVNVTCETSPEQMTALAGVIPPNVPVTIGNEINNQNPTNGEWKCGYDVYANLFNAFAQAWSGKALGIAPMDTINSDYDAARTLSQIAATNIQKDKITAVFANVYQTGSCSYEADRCSTKAGDWVVQKMKTLFGKSNFTSKDLYITELGITTCGVEDYDCLQQFYVDSDGLSAKLKIGFSRPPGQATGTTWIHTVPMLCQYWESGSLIVLRPESCGGKRQVFLYPGIEDMVPDSEKMRQMAAGYTLYCGNAFTLQGKFLNEPSGNTKNYQIGGAWADVKINSTGATIPLYRFEGRTAQDPDSETRRLDDLEGFFGATYTKENLQDQTILPLANGVAKKLTSEEYQCSQRLTYLSAIKELCDKEDSYPIYTYNDKLDPRETPNSVAPTRPPGECALFSKIPGADPHFDTYKKVLERKPAGFSCAGSTAQIDPAWAKAFSKIELTTPKGFKPAYLVHYMDRPEEQPSDFEKKTVWMASGETANGGLTDPQNIFERIKVVRVYVPAGFAEKQIESPQESFFPTYTGGFMQTVLSLMPQEIIDQVQETRTLVVNMIKRAMDAGIGSQAIVCKTCENLVSQEPYKSDPRLTIISRINAELAPNNTGCSLQDLVGETASERSKTINPPGTLDPVKTPRLTASATLITQKPDAPAEIVRTFLLLPEEYRNIADYEQHLLDTFVPYELQDEKTNKELAFVAKQSEKNANPQASYKYLQMSGSSIDVESPTFYGPNIVPGSPGPERLMGKIDAERDMTSLNANPQVPGGILARGLWEIMCNVTRPFDDHPTAPYQGFEKFLQKGVAACASESDTEKVCKVGTKVVEVSNAKISEGVVALALQVSKYTCTPPEMLIGVLAKETRGITYSSVNGTDLIGATNAPLTGDPNEKGISQYWSMDIYYPMQNNPPYILNFGTQKGKSTYILGGGPYQFTPDLLTRAINGPYSTAVAQCRSMIQITLPDGRTVKNDTTLDNRHLGDAMCLASAVMWRGIGRSCSGGATDFSSLSVQEIENGIKQFHLGDKNRPDDGTLSSYLATIQAFQSFVSEVRAKQNACIQ